MLGIVGIAMCGTIMASPAQDVRLQDVGEVKKIPILRKPGPDGKPQDTELSIPVSITITHEVKADSLVTAIYLLGGGLYAIAVGLGANAMAAFKKA